MSCENLDKDLDFVSYFLRMNSHLFKQGPFSLLGIGF